MSWSTTVIGKPPAVAQRIVRDLAGYKCVDPEEAVKQAAGAAIAAALAAQHPNSVVRVTASGHQGQNYVDGKALGIVNTLNVLVEPLHGFVE